MIAMYSHHTEGAGKNSLILAFVVLVAGAVGWCVFAKVPLREARSLMIALWPVSAIVASLVTAVLYKLVSDTAAIGKLSWRQRFELDKIVKRKVAKLWLIVTALILPLIAAHISGFFGETLWASRLVAGAFGVATAALLCAAMYVPSVWLDIRGFIIALDVEAAHLERTRSSLEQLKKDRAHDSRSKDEG
ncbi:hypothetical protein [Xanthomonas arboricola]|uniref:hypothetical protein n=1 Tax=Xanthomonas arboricola TaxID=56448 RepID=UPI00142FAEC5|nr:hypothetical protein [Xanthomonas arboricola]NJB93176.1 nitrate reductase NapE component [Xanthomonas arboricola]